VTNLDNASELHVADRGDCIAAADGTGAVASSETPHPPLETASSPHSSLPLPATLTPAESVQLWMTDSDALQGLRVVCELLFCVFVVRFLRQIVSHHRFDIRHRRFDIRRHSCHQRLASLALRICSNLTRATSAVLQP
jgi:hypothetical protein